MPQITTVDGNTAAAHIAYAFSDAAAIYPITPSSPMAEMMDEWAAQGRKNLYGQSVRVIQMQSEAGAAGTLHGLMLGGALGCTFTASQGLLLMIPAMYKMAGELLPTVFHVSARALSTHALSIFGDQSDVMSCRQTGFAMLCSASVQECADMALAAHLTALESSVPFLHFFDGFRTSHEIQKISLPTEEELSALIPWDRIEQHRARGLDPMHPRQSGTAQNPDIYFQNREACNRFYQAVPLIVQTCLEKVAALTGRHYHLFDYAGAEDAEDVLVLMGSGAETAEETVRFLMQEGRKVGVIRVRLYRPFSTVDFLSALPQTVRRIAVLDRCKEPGAQGEPLYQDVCTALHASGRSVQVIGGRYGLGGKDFTPEQVKAVFDNLYGAMRHPFTVGIDDDVTHLSLPVDETFDPAPRGSMTCKLYGYGSDGTVSACKAAIKLIGNEGGQHVQAFFSYDSRKSGGLTVCHLRYGAEPIHSAYPVTHADYVACHNPAYVTQYDMASALKPGGIFLLNCPWTAAELDAQLPADMKRTLAQRQARLYLLDGRRAAAEAGLGQRISTAMLTAFFRLTEALPFPQAVSLLKDAAARLYRKQGEDVVQRNCQVIDRAADMLQAVPIPPHWLDAPSSPADPAPKDYFHQYIQPILLQKGDTLPVSRFDPSGMVPTATSRFEKRGIAPAVPQWIPEKCIQCTLCALACPHACIRPFIAGEESVPADLPTLAATGRELAGKRFRIQVSPLDCTGCTNCVQACPAPGKALVMQPFATQQVEAAHWRWAISLPDHRAPKLTTLKDSQLRRPLLEFSGACAGCGETPYIKLITQLFGERMLIANATGCSSIYGGSAPTCPYAVDDRGHGPAWANSLFEDNAEFGLGLHLAQQHRRAALADRVRTLMDASAHPALKDACSAWLHAMEDGDASRTTGEQLQALLQETEEPLAREILRSAHLLTKKSVWIIGGDGWAYDIGFGGVDHVLASGEDVNLLVLDTEVYSNTGGQASKSTPAGAVAKFACNGRHLGKKDLGRMAMTYGHVYVAQVAMGADPAQLLRALKEAESYPGPSLIIAYAPCINHGISLANTQQEMKRAVDCGYWPLYRCDPRRDQPLTIDSKPATEGYRDFLLSQTRYSALMQRAPSEAEALLQQNEQDAARRYHALTKS